MSDSEMECGSVGPIHAIEGKLDSQLLPDALNEALVRKLCKTVS